MTSTPPPRPLPPATPHPGAPSAPKRPRPADLVLSLQIWVFVILAMAIANGYGTWTGSSDTRLRTAYDDFQTKSGKQQSLTLDYAEFRTMTLVIAIGLIVVVVAVAALLLFLLWRGVGWSRALLDVGGAFALAQGAISLVSSHDPYAAVPSILGAVAAVGALMMMHTKESTAFLQPKGRDR
ncbi:hypothetical protein [Tsukamurella soli]|uniref:Uncharacterized protein n=1 Tax=Tsukamurella soli TaxID=644556 RepID=A0ABP8J547_9ACTN